MEQHNRFAESKTFQKEELHKTALSAFVQNGLEQDKVLLSLNVASIGFFISFLTDFKVEVISDFIILVIIGLSILFFLISTASILLIFSENKKYLKELLKGNFQDNKLLEILDKYRLWSFILGVLFGIIFSIFIVVDNINLKEQKMAEEQKKEKSLNGLGSHMDNQDNDKKVNESLNQLGSHMNDDNKSSGNDPKQNGSTES